MNYARWPSLLLKQAGQPCIILALTVDALPIDVNNRLSLDANLAKPHNAIFEAIPLSLLSPSPDSVRSED